MNQPMGITRRDCVRYIAASATLGCAADHVARAEEAVTRSGEPVQKQVAAVMTVYHKWSHPDVILGKIFEGWKQDGGPGSALQVVSMYVDQPVPNDLAQKMSAKYNVPIFDTIEKTVTVGGDRIPIDGVISLGEGGNYSANEKEQDLFPRRRFFEEITDTFVKCDRVVPVFNDKHLGPVWSDAKWMYDRALQLNIPFMAGSSLPVTFRTPEISVPMGCQIEGAVAIGYSKLDAYGCHTLESLQCLVERREGGETGVRWVQCLQGEAMWNAVDQGLVRKDLITAALSAIPSDKKGPPAMRANPQAALFLFQYNDGLLGSVFMLPDTAGAISVALKIKGQPQPLATWFEERKEPSFPHFAYLMKAIERFIHSGRPSYPVERTLLISGILDRALTSRHQDQRRLMTPELAIRYQPINYPHAPLPDLYAGV